jgi:glyoxylase-like metal-dependent hydrolase (beta-lactamase superfamily II)/rhodanese-related sulfurtransferase
MHFKQFYLNCLAHASYLIGSRGEAAVVDPQRDVEQYLEDAAANGLQIKYVIETHFHADFVSGHRELSGRTGAEIVFGAEARAGFPHKPVKDGDEIHLGAVTLRFLETPGHTPESISILVIDSEVSSKPQKVLTGDTLFIGDVGRPDLVAAKGFTAPQMAGMLYDSLHNKLLTLDDAIEIYPAHGAGSMCGRNISSATFSTIGEQRRFNYALQPMSRDKFVSVMTADLPDPPAYFSRDAEINRSGASDLSDVPPARPVEPAEFADLQKSSIVLDIREAPAFGASHVPGSLNIALRGQFASWAGSLIPANARILLIGEDEDQIHQAVVRLARVGLDSVVGYLNGGIHAWEKAGQKLEQVPQIAVDELHARLGEKTGLQVVDVRRPDEYKAGHVPGAINVPLSGLRDSPLPFGQDTDVAVICAGGYRSSTATSILKSRGLPRVLNVVAGTSAWANAGYEVAL